MAKTSAQWKALAVAHLDAAEAILAVPSTSTAKLRPATASAHARVADAIIQGLATKVLP